MSNFLSFSKLSAILNNCWDLIRVTSSLVLEDKIVEIDYDKSIMVIHDSMEDVKARTMAVDMIWRGSAMFIEGQLRIKNKTCKGLFLFDTGSKWALSLNKTFASQNQLYGIMEKTGTRRAKGVDGKTIKSHTVINSSISLPRTSMISRAILW